AVGLDDPKLGEVPVAAVRLTDGASITPTRLRTWAAKHLSDYKTPRRIFIVDDLPKTGTNKLQRSELAQRLERLD
ncbi:MAG: hypothetical protein KDB24_11695, partial [Microthrixaceae bacterium]|nr:hypothetical protein [Microthrixaceae bacterium]